jgi:hypothetical protein
MLHCSTCNGPLENAFQSCPKCEPKAAAALASKTDTSSQSQPLPLFASYEEPEVRTAGRRKKFFTIVAVLVLVLVAREAGLFNLYLCGYSASSKTHAVFQGNGLTEADDAATYSQQTREFQSTYDTKGRQYGFDFSVFSGKPPAVDLQDEIQKCLRQESTIVASVEAVDLSGSYWTPLVKNGHCKFRVRLQIVGKDAIVYTGTMEGETDFDFSGFCPVRTLKELLAAEIAQRIIASRDSLR